jgi:glycosyltransferase involved in cell wall biosynthesis
LSYWLILKLENKKPDILFISSWYPNKVWPLNGIFVKRHAAACTANCNVSAIYVRSDEKKSIDESVEDGIYTIRGYYRNPRLHIPLLSDIVRVLRYFIMWKKVLRMYVDKKGKPALVNAAIIFPVSIIAIIIKYIYKVPYIITEHWSGYLPGDRRYKGFVMKTVSRMAVAHAEAVITVSAILGNAMKRTILGNKKSIHENKFAIIPNAVDTGIFTIKPSARVMLGKDNFNLLHISSLEKEKNVPGIIRAFKKFHAANPLSRLTMIWDEETVGLPDRMGESFSEEDGIFLCGKHEGLELAALIQQADAFVLFSYFETQSVVLLEALCCGIPVISSRCGGPEEFITPSNGLLVAVGNETQLAEAMETMLKNKGKYNPEEIRNSVANKVSKEAVARDFYEIYKKVLKF